MRALLSFVGGFGFNLAYVWALPNARLWISLLIVASVAILGELSLVLAEEQLWSWARSVFHVSASIWRLLVGGEPGEQLDNLAPIASVATAIVGWSVVTLVDEVANGDLVARIVLLSVGGVLLFVAVAACAALLALRRQVKSLPPRTKRGVQQNAGALLTPLMPDLDPGN